ncbi:MAG: MbtH family protein [Acidobacteriota bacterium]|nr:MbtH family protein [Acidobacteriota bacterium]MDH3524854.1 MbtH family protein [Acidobacteriota bacterium]
MSRFKVVINHEEQYSIWPLDRENPRGWKDVGKSGTEQQCLDYIEEVWTDMRPLSPKDRAQKLVQMKARIHSDARRR